MSAFRTDIHGLRAIAVLLVVLFHIHEPMVPGGFIGVDIFFVISGFVITSGILKDRAKGTFSFLEFYRKRFRRIFPVMFFVTIVTVIVGAFILLPEDFVALSWSALFAAFSASNIYFTYFLDTSYFAADSRLTLLLHLWSLGVEEQFYILWPALLLLLLKWPRITIPAIGVLIVGSVVAGQVLLDKDQFSFAYYMLPSRIFQLASGGLMVFLIQTALVKKISQRTLLILGCLGMVIITGSAWLTDPVKFPGINAVPVTLGVSLVILSGIRQNLLYRVLSIRPAQFFGDISYSLYLWHWPVLAFMRYSYIDINLANGILAFLGMVALSFMSYRLIENPFRRTSKPFSSVLTNFFILPAAVLTALCFAVIGWKGIIPPLAPANYALRLTELSDQVKPAYSYSYICQKTELVESDTSRSECIINSAVEPRVLLWGDSHAAHYVGILGEIAKKQNFSFRNIEHSSCPPILDGASQFTSGKNVNRCKKSGEIVRPILKNYDTIILAASWSSYQKFDKFQESLRETIASLQAQNKKIIVIGQAPSFRGYDRNCSKKAIRLGTDCERKFSYKLIQPATANESLKNLVHEFPHIKYIDFTDAICRNGVCSPYNDGVPMYFDSGHLSMFGSWAIGKKAADMDAYKNFLAD